MNEQQCWQAVQARDAGADGRFFYGVLTTGVYCRPSCASRRPLRRNVRFYETMAAAERDGLRPCKRCRPASGNADPMTRKVQALCRHLEAHAEAPLTLAAMGQLVHASPFHLQRRFKALLGVTPRQYHESCRLQALKAALRKGGSVTGAIYDAGFGSASRVYEGGGRRLGMTPRQYRGGGAGVEISWAIGDTPLGLLIMAATDRGLCLVQFGEDRAELEQRVAREFPQARIAPMPATRAAEFRGWMQALAAHLANAAQPLDLPLDVRGTAFQMRVWEYLQRIPRGEVRSYTEVAQAIGQPRAARAVARACATNRIAVLIPCHRVLRGDGDLAGYRWGIERKRALLDRERAARAGTG